MNPMVERRREKNNLIIIVIIMPLNYRTDTFAQPGLAARCNVYLIFMCFRKTCCQADEVIDTPRANNKCPTEGHLVALVIAPDSDFHWYRKGRNGYWTHKPGRYSSNKLR